MFSCSSLRAFFRRDDGAVTVDFVVLTAGIVGLGVATYGVVSGGAATQSAAVNAQLETDHVSTSFGSAVEVAAATPQAAAQPQPSTVCTPDGGHCAVDNDGDGMVDELRNHSRGKNLNVEGNGLTMQGYADSGWS
jgi:hypothetical protein